MSDDSPRTPDNGSAPSELDQILARFEQELDEYRPTDALDLVRRREALIARHPQYEAEIHRYFVDADAAAGLVDPKIDDTVPFDNDDQSDSFWLSPGETIGYTGDYRIEPGPVKRGGMGVVYKARQLSVNRIVALKMILADHALSGSAIERFRNEAKAMGGLKHPGIVAIHEVQEHEERPFFTMDYIDGGSLADRLKISKLSPREAATVLLKTAEAVQFAHERGIIHRDLKPSNILLDENGEPHVADFGLAKRLNEDCNLTDPGQTPGTVLYMAPEQIRPGKRDVSTHSDIWALGVMLYEMLTGKLPFGGSSSDEIRENIRKTEPTRPRDHATKIPRDLETICLKCLAKDTQRRIGSARELAEHLRDFLHGKPVELRPITRVERLWRWCKRNTLVATLAATIVASLVVGIALTSYFAIKAEERAADLQASEGFLRDERNSAMRLAAEKNRLAQDKTKLASDNGQLAENVRLALLNYHRLKPVG